MINLGWLDGASFYMFMKKGGVNNLIDCFIWMGDLLSKIDENY